MDDCLLYRTIGIILSGGKGVYAKWMKLPLRIYVTRDHFTTIPVNLTVHLYIEPNDGFVELDSLLKRVSTKILENMFNKDLDQLRFRIIDGAYHLFDPFESVLQKNLGEGIANIKSASVEIPFLEASEVFRGVTKDAIEYSAVSTVCYQPKVSNANISQVPLDRDIIENCMHKFSDAWQTRTLGDYIKTYDKRSKDEQDLFDCPEQYRLAFHKRGDVVTIREQCHMDKEIKELVLKMFRIQAAKDDTYIIWSFFWLFGLCFGYAHESIFEFMAGFDYVNGKAEMDTVVRYIRMALLATGIVVDLLVWLIVLPIMNYLASITIPEPWILMKILMALLIGPLAFILP